MFQPADFETLKDKISGHFADLIDQSINGMRVNALELRATELMDKIDAVRHLAREYEMLDPVDDNAHDALVAALTEAIQLIRIWHGEEGWDIYAKHSPEMKRLYAALELAAPKEAVR